MSIDTALDMIDDTLRAMSPEVPRIPCPGCNGTRYYYDAGQGEGRCAECEDGTVEVES